ncbi:Versiconal hemiacetal acetate esterase [Colletotrichum viniferum]|nr:Versiconal hemiacetal acetate esterase [Colletotrichum viniferum]
MAHSYLAYIRLKAVISTLRYLDEEKPAPAQPDEVFTITARDGKRGIRVHVYRPGSPTTPSPVLVNWNGGAFVFDAHGADQAFCRHVARHTPFTVLDASYALAPEEPFPAAVEDALDVVAHVLSRMGEYDVGRVVLCGFSSGGNLALAACAAGMGRKVRGVVAFYPPTEMRTHPAEKRMLDGSLEGMPAVRRAVMGMLREAYLSGGEAEAGDARPQFDLIFSVKAVSVNLASASYFHSVAGQFASPSPLEDTGVVLESQNVTAEFFIGAPAQAQTLPKKTHYIPDVVGFHQDGGNTRTNDWNGPLGASPNVSSRSVAVSAQYWHSDNRLTARSVCTDAAEPYFCIAAFDPDSMDMLGSWAPEGQTLLSPYAAVSGDMVILPTMERHIFQVERVDGTNSTTFNQVRDIDLTAILPQGHGVVSSYLDGDENIWFTSVALMTTGTAEDSSRLGYVTPNGIVHIIALDGQRVENSIAVSGRTVYLNTGPLAFDTARSTVGHMFAFRADAINGHIKALWNTTYDAGNAPKPGGFSQGSGSTPALIGDKYVAITDNADVQVNLLIYRQVDASADGLADGQVPLVCAVPLFQPNGSANENAMVGYFDESTYSVLVNNNHGAPELQDLGAAGDANGAFIDFAPLAPGITRVDVGADGRCAVCWALDVRSTSVLSLSTANGLVYSYKQDEELAGRGPYVWYFTAIDFRSGEVVWRIRAGAGGWYNNNVAPTQMSPNGAIYQVVAGGVTWLRDD